MSRVAITGSRALSAGLTRVAMAWLVLFRNRAGSFGWAWAVAVALAGLGPIETWAADSTFRSDPDYLIDTWQTEDGLPENSATAMVQTPDGYLWFGTWDGLTRFDGVSFSVFNPANTPQLPSAGIVNLHVDRSGRLWVSTVRGLVVRDGTSWRVGSGASTRTAGRMFGFVASIRDCIDSTRVVPCNTGALRMGSSTQPAVSCSRIENATFGLGQAAAA